MADENKPANLHEEKVTLRLESQETPVAFAIGYRAAIRDVINIFGLGAICLILTTVVLREIEK